MAKWKQISKLLAEMHNTHGRAAVTMGGENAFAKAIDSELSFREIPEAHLLTSWKDVELTPKMIRRWMWDIRQDEVLKEENVFAWTVQNEENSVGGFGTLVEPDEQFPPLEVTDG